MKGAKKILKLTQQNNIMITFLCFLPHLEHTCSSILRLFTFHYHRNLSVGVNTIP